MDISCPYVPGKLMHHIQPIKSKVKVLPAPMAYRAVHISISVALAHTSTNAKKATAGGVWSTGSSACLTFPLHSLMSSARREGCEYHF